MKKWICSESFTGLIFDVPSKIEYYLPDSEKTLSAIAQNYLQVRYDLVLIEELSDHRFGSWKYVFLDNDAFQIWQKGSMLSIEQKLTLLKIFPDLIECEYDQDDFIDSLREYSTDRYLEYLQHNPNALR